MNALKKFKNNFGKSGAKKVKKEQLELGYEEEPENTK